MTSTPDRPRIVAVAVTFNRAELVSRLVREAARGSVVPDEIVVIDNASTDDTVARLAALADLPTTVSVVSQTANTGGAGGFARGMQEALARGADLVWLMDDDGVPAPDCLELLLPHMDDHDFVGPAVVTEGKEAQLCFPIRLPRSASVVRRVEDLEAAADEGLVDGIVIPFNGVLVTRDLIEKIGVVEAKYFIWGDDVEYLWRAQRAGARVATVTAARFAHPAADELGTPMAFGQTFNHSPSALKAYCMARNNWVNLRTYRGLVPAWLFVAKTIWFYSLTRRDPARLRLSLRAVRDGMRRNFAGHLAFLNPPPPSPEPVQTPVGPIPPGRVAAVVVTFNRAHLLSGCLDALFAGTVRPDAVYVVDNASTDETAALLAGRGEPELVVLRQETNTGGAGGFNTGVRAAYAAGFDWIWLMDDDVVAAPDCLAHLLVEGGPAASVTRKDRSGRLVEKAATEFDLSNPLRIKPKAASVETSYGMREAMPPTVALDNVAFEGFMVHRTVIDRVGFPDPSFFIFYDDCDYALRIRRAGFPIVGVRDAVMTRQLDFDQQHDLSGWKGYFMYRNLFVVHQRYGTNALVRAKPWLITAGVVALSPVRGGRAEARNVVRALRDARGMRHLPAVAGPGGLHASLDSPG